MTDRPLTRAAEAHVWPPSTASTRWPGLAADALITAVLVGVLLALFVPLGREFGFAQYFLLDHNAHERLALELAATGRPPVPHFLYHYLVIGFHELTGATSWRAATALAMTVPHAAFAAVTCVLFRLSVPAPGTTARLLSAAFAIALTLGTPPFLLGTAITGVPNHHYLLGYLTPTVYHNPTYTLMRPLTLALFALVAVTALDAGPQSRRMAMISAGALIVLVVLNGIAKPSFLIVLLPALALWTLIRLLRRQPIAWLPVVVGVGLPGALILGWQYIVGFTDETTLLGESSIVLAPLEVLWTFPEMTLERAALYFGLSIMPPLIIWMLGGREARRDAWFTFGWLALIVGAAYLYLLMESGWRKPAANFAWSAYAGALVLNAAAFRLTLRAAVGRKGGTRPRAVAAGGTLVAVVVSTHGLIFLTRFVGWLTTQQVFFR